MKVSLVPKGLKQIEEPTIKRVLSDMWEEINRVVNTNLTLGSPQAQASKQAGNIQGTWPGSLKNGYTIQTHATPNTEFIVTHNLGKIPTGYDVKSKDAAGIVYDSRRQSWTKTQMYLKCSVSSMNIVLFVH